MAALASGVVFGAAVETGERPVLLVSYPLGECDDLWTWRLNAGDPLKQRELDLPRVVVCERAGKRLRLPAGNPVEEGCGSSSQSRIVAPDELVRGLLDVVGEAEVRPHRRPSSIKPQLHETLTDPRSSQLALRMSGERPGCDCRRAWRSGEHPHSEARAGIRVIYKVPLQRVNGCDSKQTEERVVIAVCDLGLKN